MHKYNTLDPKLEETLKDQIYSASYLILSKTNWFSSVWTLRVVRSWLGYVSLGAKEMLDSKRNHKENGNGWKFVLLN